VRSTAGSTLLVYTGGEPRFAFQRRISGDRRVLQYGYCYYVDPHHRLFFPDCGGVAAERQGRGLGRSVRRHGIADGFRAARIGDAAFEGYHACGGDFHGYLDHPVHLRAAAGGFLGQRFGAHQGSGENDGARSEEQRSASAGSSARAAGACEQEVTGFTNAVVAELADALA
jgi:hypothetical protein